MLSIKINIVIDLKTFYELFPVYYTKYHFYHKKFFEVYQLLNLILYLYLKCIFWVRLLLLYYLIAKHKVNKIWIIQRQVILLLARYYKLLDNFKYLLHKYYGNVNIMISEELCWGFYGFSYLWYFMPLLCLYHPSKQLRFHLITFQLFNTERSHSKRTNK